MPAASELQEAHLVLTTTMRPPRAHSSRCRSVAVARDGPAERVHASTSGPPDYCNVRYRHPVGDRRNKNLRRASPYSPMTGNAPIRSATWSGRHFPSTRSSIGSGAQIRRARPTLGRIRLHGAAQGSRPEPGFRAGPVGRPSGAIGRLDAGPGEMAASPEPARTARARRRS